MNAFIKLTSLRTGNPMIIPTDTIDIVVIEEGKTTIKYKDTGVSVIKETVDEVWAMLKPSVIFC